MASVYLDEEKIGTVFHYFHQVRVAAIELQGSIKVGDKIRVYGTTTNFIQIVESIEIFSKQVAEAAPGQKVGIRIKYKCRKGDIISKIHEF